MKPVYSAADLFRVTHIQSVLAMHGIETYIKNNYLSGAAGEIPVFETWPQLYVQDESQYQRALRLIKEEENAPIDTTPWRCPACQELIDGEFQVCWACGFEKTE